MSYCLQNALPENERTMENLLNLAAKEDIQNVELYAGGWKVDDIRSASEALRKHADAAGVTLPVYGSGTRLGNINDQKTPAMALLKQEVEACAILGGSTLTYPVIDGQPVDPNRPNAAVGVRFEQMLPELVEQIQELADHAAQFNVNIAVLNHCFLVYLGWHQKWMTRLADRTNAGACVDPGNYLHYGHQNPVDVCKDLAPIAKMARAGGVAPVPENEIAATFKETGQFRPWGATLFDNGAIDQAACYRNLAAGGYTGYVSLKTAGTHPDGPLTAIRHSWKALSDLLAAIA